jgi:von Willebrand factor A domain-containing protein 7
MHLTISLLSILRAGGLVAAALLAGLVVPARAQDQDQLAKRQPGWPCVGTVDPTYVRSAEATGGKVLLLKPTEVAGSAVHMIASDRHPATIFTAGGQHPDGTYDFEIPIDSTVESAYFFLSFQCLRAVSVIRPSGEELRTDAADVEYHPFQAVRLFTVQAPGPGLWKVKISGRGLLTLAVHAKTDLRLTSVAFMEDGVPVKGGPTPGRPQRLEAGISGAASDAAFQFVSRVGATIQSIELQLEKESDSHRTYGGEVTPPGTAFRLAVTGTDAQGLRYQRVHKHLLLYER